MHRRGSTVMRRIGRHELKRRIVSEVGGRPAARIIALCLFPVNQCDRSQERAEPEEDDWGDSMRREVYVGTREYEGTLRAILVAQILGFKRLRDRGYLWIRPHEYGVRVPKQLRIRSGCSIQSFQNVYLVTRLKASHVIFVWDAIRKVGTVSSFPKNQSDDSMIV